MPPASALLQCTVTQRPFQCQCSKTRLRRPVVARCRAEAGNEHTIASRRGALQVRAHQHAYQQKLDTPKSCPTIQQSRLDLLCGCFPASAQVHSVMMPAL